RAPKGAVTLPPPTGVTPAVTVEHAGARVGILPGPPRELQAVFTETVEPRFLEGTGVALWREEVTHRFPESTFASVLSDLQARFPSASIGSYPQPIHMLMRTAARLVESQALAK